jgi:hypothetical protein
VHIYPIWDTQFQQVKRLYMKSSCLTILDELGCIPIPSKAESVVSESIKKSFEDFFGQAATVAILDHLASVYGLSERELTTNYDIFEKALYSISSYGTKLILMRIKEEVLTEATRSVGLSSITEQDIIDQSVGIGRIIKKISHDEINKFVYEMPGDKHIALIYEEEGSKDKLLSAFFNASHRGDGGSRSIQTTIISRGLISNRQTKPVFVQSVLHYDDLAVNKSGIIKKIWDWINGFNNKNDANISEGVEVDDKDDNNNKRKSKSKQDRGSKVWSRRLAVENIGWFSINHLIPEFLSFEETITEYVRKQNMQLSVLCSYKASDVSSKNRVEKPLSYHDYIILEDPPVIYKTTKREHNHATDKSKPYSP